MTNFEKIKSFSVEEMARFIDALLYDGKECWEYVQTWLESEVEDA